MQADNPLTIDNYGMLSGSVLLGTGSYIKSTVTNYEGGTLAFGATFDIGDGGTTTLSNAGTMSPDGTGSIGTTSLTADTITQTSTGHLPGRPHAGVGLLRHQAPT